MKCYKKLFFFPFLLIIFITLFSGFGHSSNAQLIEEILEKRTNILQQAYFDRIRVEDAEKKLIKIEAQPLLGTDIERLRNKVSSDMDMVEDVRVESLREIAKYNNYLSYQCEIRWHIKGLSSDYKEVIQYHIVLKKEGNEYKLSEFTAIKNK